MPAIAAAIACALGVLALFYLDRDKAAPVSRALWIPVLWVALASSRMVSQWLGLAASVENVAQAAEGNALDRNILMAFIAIGMIVLMKRGRVVGTLLRANLPLLAFLLYCAASVLWSDFPGVAFKRWTKAVGDLVMILIVLTDPDPRAAIKSFLARYGFLLVPASVLFIKYYPALGQNYSGMEGHVKYTGVTLDKNMLGVVCLIAGLGCVFRFIEFFRQPAGTRRAGQMLAQGTLFVMVLWLFRIANSMTSLACFILAAGLIMAASSQTIARRRAVVHALVVGMLAVVVAGLFLDVGSDLVETMGRNQGLTGRTDLWKDVLDINQSPWLGRGFESFWLGDRLVVLWAKYWWHPNEAHNGYLEVFLNLGAVGLAMLAVIIATGYRNAVAALRHDATGGLRLAFFVVGVAYSFTEAGFRVMHPVWILFMMSAFALRESPALQTADAGGVRAKPAGPAVPTIRRTPSRVPVRALARNRTTLVGKVR